MPERQVLATDNDVLVEVLMRISSIYASISKKVKRSQNTKAEIL
jgi:hypothetical protein